MPNNVPLFFSQLVLHTSTYQNLNHFPYHFSQGSLILNCLLWFLLFLLQQYNAKQTWLIAIYDMYWENYSSCTFSFNNSFHISHAPNTCFTIIITEWIINISTMLLTKCTNNCNGCVRQILSVQYKTIYWSNTVS